MAHRNSGICIDVLYCCRDHVGCFAVKIDVGLRGKEGFGLGMSGEMSFSMVLMFVFFSFSIFGGLESISDSAHVLGVIDTAMDQLDALKAGNYIDRDGKEIFLERYDIEFSHVDFGNDERMVLKGTKKYTPERFPAVKSSVFRLPGQC